MTSPTAPYIPETAPFNPEQRAWLNGFLAGLYSSAPQDAAAPAAATLRFGLYFASQTGTAERLAKKMAKELKAKGHTAEVASLEKITPAVLAQQQHALIFASTYGEGDPPDSATSFRDALFSDAAPMLSGLRYSVFALGDHHYENFCKFGTDLDLRLETLGATRLIPITESDVDVDAPFEQWKSSLWPKLVGKAEAVAAAVEAGPAATPVAAERAHIFTRENPYPAELRERRPLTSDVSSKQTMHLSFALADEAFHYQAGDACGVIAQNDPALVHEILALLPFDPTTQVEIPRLGTMSIEAALSTALQPTRLSRKIVQHFAEKADASMLKALLPAEQGAHLETFLYDRGLIDLLAEYPGVIQSPAELVAILPRLAPRLYSISSSPAAHGPEIHCTIAVVRYRSHNRQRGGICSTMLADRVALGTRQPIYIQPNTRFRLPAADTPMIMIGPGTGIAPFRSFLHERQALGHAGRNWLFFGERRADTDFLYREELQTMVADHHLTRLDTAFSRDQEAKIYVQDRMIEQGAELWRWLSEGGQVFVCGDASRMARDVDAALHKVIEQHGSMDADAAKDFVAQMHDDRRYHRDVY
jgi:sulfite reductase (NADPH) flavoprotein alpha-component